MTYFLLSITNKCNKACPYCVVKPWLNNPEYPDKATAADFILFLKKEFQSGDAVELTGGEPTLFPDLEKMLDWLKERAAKVILRTNGLNLGEWRKKYSNLIVVLAKHDSTDGYMRDRKKHLLAHDLTIESIPESIKQKSPFKAVFAKSEESPWEEHPFERSFFVSADGKVRAMACCSNDMGTVWNYKPRKYQVCGKCDTIIGAYDLITKIKEEAK